MSEIISFSICLDINTLTETLASNTASHVYNAADFGSYVHFFYQQ